jgi:hypothetical protein
MNRGRRAGFELDLDLGGEPPPTRPWRVRPSVVRPDRPNDAALRDAVADARRGLANELAVDDLVEAILFGDREQIGGAKRSV